MSKARKLRHLRRQGETKSETAADAVPNPTQLPETFHAEGGKIPPAPVPGADPAVWLEIGFSSDEAESLRAILEDSLLFDEVDGRQQVAARLLSQTGLGNDLEPDLQKYVADVLGDA